MTYLLIQSSLQKTMKRTITKLSYLVKEAPNKYKLPGNLEDVNMVLNRQKEPVHAVKLIPPPQPVDGHLIIYARRRNVNPAWQNDWL